MRSLSALIFGGDGDYYDSEQRKRVKCEPATLKVGMTEANFSNKNLGAAGAIIISSWMSNKGDKGALSSLSLAHNQLGYLIPPTGWEANTNGTHSKP